MKKLYAYLSALAACLLCAASVQAAQVKFIVDNAAAVKLEVYSYTTYSSTYPEVVEGENVIEFDSSEYSRVTVSSTPGYFLLSVKGADASYGDLYINSNQATLDLNSYTEGRTYTVNTVDEESFRSASATVTVTDDPTLVRVKRGNEYIDLTESQTVIKFNPEAESYFQVFRTDYQNVCNVKLNGVSLSNSGSSFAVQDGDAIEVTASYPDISLPVIFTFPEGMDDIITSVSVNYDPVTDWNSPDFAVASGANMSFQLNDSKYSIERVLINDEVQSSYSNYYSLRVGLEPIDIVIEAHPWNDVNFTVNVDDPTHVTVTTYSGDVLTLTGTSTPLAIPEKNPMIAIKAAPDYIIESLTDGDGNPISLNPYNKSMTVTEGMVINIVTKEKEFDASFAVYLDTTEGLYQANWVDEESREYHDLAAGYNIVKFISSQEINYQVSTYGNNPWIAYVNGAPVTNEYQSPSYTWRGVPEDGMVIKLFLSGNEPELHSVSLSVSDDLAGKVSVTHDRLVTWPAFNSTANFHAGTQIDVTLADGTEATVCVDGTPVTPDENGVHTLTVSADHELTVSASNAITAAEAAPAGIVSDVYNLQGIRVLSGATSADLRSLPAGIYIFGGKKTVVK